MIENYEQVRERIAWFLGYEYGIAITAKDSCSITTEGWFHPDRLWTSAIYHTGYVLVGADDYYPDPLRNPADAWALQCAIEARGIDVVCRREPQGYARLLECQEFEKAGRGKTPAEALVRAWMEAFPDE